MPVLSLAVLYLLAIIPVAVAWGIVYAVGTAIGSMLAFNFFFLPPLYTLTPAGHANWFALLVFLVTAVVVSELATRSRRRAEEAEAALAALRELTEERERLAEEALEAEALRRSDALKTALLRAVCHDLRSPLMAILASAGALASTAAFARAGRPARLAETIRGEASAARPPREQPARPLAARGRRGRAGAASCGRRRASSARRSTGSREASRVEVDFRRTTAAGRGRPRPDRARARQPRRERAALLAGRLAVRVQVGARRHGAADARHRPRAGHARRRAGAHLRAVPRGGRGRARRAASAWRSRAGFAEANGGTALGRIDRRQRCTFVLALPLAERPAEVPA